MHNELLSVEQVTKLIQKGRALILSGEESLLAELPNGKWIGGTIPYFMAPGGGCFVKDKVFVNDMSEYATDFSIHKYSAQSINKLVKDSYDNGFSYLLIPGFSDVLAKFALEAQNIEGLYDNPVVGWVTGIDLEQVGQQSPKVFNGLDGSKSDNEAIIMHVKLPENKLAALEIINIFEQGNGDTFRFKVDGFECTSCYVNGEEKNLAEYIKENKVDTRLPLVADYSGAMINISFQQVDQENGKVLFYAPLRAGVDYKLAKPVGNYIEEFTARLPDQTGEVVSSFNCILNYLYSELEGKQTGKMLGPFTFGEIAYVLVNQTLVYLSISKR